MLIMVGAVYRRLHDRYVVTFCFTAKSASAACRNENLPVFG